MQTPSHNADGSSKYTFFGGAGVTIPTGGTHAYFSPNYDFQVGGGRNFNKKVALLLQFDWDAFNIQTATLNSLLATYNGPTVGASLAQVGGHAHIWSFTVDPMYTFYQAEKVGTYVIGGVGFYQKVTDFTTPCNRYLLRLLLRLLSIRSESGHRQLREQCRWS